MTGTITGADTKFITNEAGQTLRDRFRVLIKDTRLFDVLVGFFYTSGFHALYKSLENTEHIRILIGIGTSKQTYDLMHQAESALQGTFEFSHAEAKEEFSKAVTGEMEKSEDSGEVEGGVANFIEWLQNGKLEIKAYPSHNIHAKLYIMTLPEGDKDKGRVITGSSNFTQAGFVDNLEFNIELKDAVDYEFALARFNELWADAADLKDVYIDTVRKKSWLNDAITPYQLYLKFLYEYFKDVINIDAEELDQQYVPEGFLDLEYQKEAVKDAKRKLEEYGGVFISDVVGLGKTYIAAMLAGQLKGRNLVISPPALLSKDNPGSWVNVFNDFRVPAYFESVGKLDDLLARGCEGYQNIFIDEAHHFRTEDNVTYEKMAQICRGKRIILVTATPLNNTPKDILSQIKLFQKTRKSTIPNLPDLETFFGRLEKKLNGLDRQKDYDKYMKAVADNAREIRDKVLKYIMVRRTRNEIIKYFGDDLKKQKLKFPEVADPESVFYQLDPNEDKVFNRTIELVTHQFHYARYTPMLYYQGPVTQPEELAQKNMRKFMKILLVKRLESSFHAFRNSIGRFIKSYEQFLKEFGEGSVYVSKKYSNKLFELLENDDDAAIQKLIDEDKAKQYKAADFTPGYKDLLEGDLAVLREIDELWKTVTRDPKMLEFTARLSSEKLLREGKLIIFTESRETAEYLEQSLRALYPKKVLLISGSSEEGVRNQVIANFDARAKHKKDDFRILVTTEVLSEGVNLHRSNIVINYDLPWNPIRMMQRVGRVNRVDTRFDKIFTFNFFPTTQSNDQIKLKEAAEYKIQAFINMLGSDARLLTDGEEITSHELFAKLTSKKTITGEDEDEDSELKYLQVIRNIRDNDRDLFDQIKRLPRKARTGRLDNRSANGLLTYFRKGKTQKFYLAGGEPSRELDFLGAARVFEAEKETPRLPPASDYYDLLKQNKDAFYGATSGEPLETKSKGGRDNTTFLLKVLKSNQVKHFKGYTDDDDDYIKKVIALLEDGALPRQTTRTVAREVAKDPDPLKILARLRGNIPWEFFKEPVAGRASLAAEPREVILSEHLLSEAK